MKWYVDWDYGGRMKKFIDEIVDIIHWIINRKEIQKQIELDDKQYNNLLIQLRKANRKVIELETEINIILSERS